MIVDHVRRRQIRIKSLLAEIVLPLVLPWIIKRIGRFKQWTVPIIATLIFLSGGAEAVLWGQIPREATTMKASSV